MGFELAKPIVRELPQLLRILEEIFTADPYDFPGTRHERSGL
jgi:hypothetical protein